MSNKVVWCEGDSLTFGQGSSGGLTYPVQLQTLLGTGYAVNNLGASTETLSDMITQQASLFPKLYSFHVKRVVIIFGGTNDIFFGANGQTAYSRLVTYCNNVRALLNRPYLITASMIARGEDNIPAGFEDNRQDFNSRLRAGWSGLVDAFYDVASDVRLGAPTAYNNTTYFDADKTHLNNAGYALLAQGFYLALQRI